jgi:hypothetical protein
MKMISLLIIIISLLLNGSICQILPTYKPNGVRTFSNGINFTNILIIDESIYIGAKDAIFKFDLNNIEDTTKQVQVDLRTNIEQKDQCIATYYDEELCNNFIKTVIHRKSNNDILVCGNYAFTPRLFQFTFDLKLIKEEDGYGYCSLNPLDSSTAIWIDNGNPLNIGSLYTASLLDASAKTRPVEPVIYRPELKLNDKTFQYLRTPKFDLDWLYQPEFIASFDVDNYVLFFIRERSIEQIAEDESKFYSRVLRVCKSDVGSVNLGDQWSSLRKIRLTCVYNNTHLDNLKSIIQIDDETFIGTFSLNLPHGHNGASFVCEFKKSMIVSSLNGEGSGSSFKELIPGTQYWAKLPIDKLPVSLPSNCDYNSQQLKDEAVNFVRSHCLVGGLVEGKMISFINEQITSLTFDLIDQIRIFYLGTGKTLFK